MFNMKPRFFHTFNEEGQIKYQGMVLHRGKTHVNVQLFSWLTGMENGQKRFPNEDMDTWRFYDSQSAWRAAGGKTFA
jgi:hypothetical protein